MITPRSRILIEAAEDYAISDAELVDMIELCVCAFYDVTFEQLISKSRKRAITTARRMYFMLSINTVIKIKGIQLARHLGQSHCMVSHAKNKLLELEEKWAELVAGEYDEIEMMVIHRVLLHDKPISEKDNNFLTELAELMNNLKVFVCEQGSSHHKLRLMNILQLIAAAEGKGLSNQVESEISDVILRNLTRINEEALQEVLTA